MALLAGVQEAFSGVIEKPVQGYKEIMISAPFYTATRKYIYRENYIQLTHQGSNNIHLRKSLPKLAMVLPKLYPEEI